VKAQHRHAEYIRLVIDGRRRHLLCDPGDPNEPALPRQRAKGQFGLAPGSTVPGWIDRDRWAEVDPTAATVVASYTCPSTITLIELGRAAPSTTREGLEAV